ncbi:MAG TPA: hypothetical protein DEQ03_16150 [Marinilabiliales bacterium]|nr:hypothetical protein [Marinilabiliales bacterium]
MNAFKKFTTNIRIALFSALVIALVLVLIFLVIIFRLRSNAIEDSNQKAVLVSKEVKHSIEEFFHDAFLISNLNIENFLKYRQQGIPRKMAYQFMENSISKRSSFLAYWTMWEPNAYDQADDKYMDDPLHDPYGHFAMTYYYFRGQITVEINDSADYLEDYYSIPAKLKRPIILDPYHYQYHGNEKVYYETSLINPIMVKDTFLGVFGIDFDLNLLQQELQHKKVFASGFVSLLSNSGMLVTHPDPAKVDHKISEFLHPENHNILDSMETGMGFKTQQNSEFLKKPVVRFFYPIYMEYMVAPWYIMIEIPQDEIYNSVKKVQVIALLVLAILLVLLVYLVFILFYDRKNKENLLEAYQKVVQSELNLKIAHQGTLESEEKYRAIFNNANDAIFLMTGDRFIDCNELTLRMFQCQRHEIIGEPPYLFSPEYQPDGSTSYNKALEKIEAAYSGIPQFFEWTHQTLNKKPFDAEVSLTKVIIQDQTFILAIVRNITERKNLEKAHRDEKQFTDQLINSLPASFYLYDMNLKLRRWNHLLVLESGYSPEELEGFEMRNWFKSEKEFENIIGHLKRVMDSSSPLQMEMVLVDKKGNEIPYLVTTEKLDMPDGPMLMGVGQNIAVLVNTRNENRRILSLQNAILEHAGYALIATDTDGIIHIFNKTAEKMLGYLAEEIIDKETPMLFHCSEEVKDLANLLSQKTGETLEPGFDVFVQDARIGNPIACEWTYIHKNGTRFPVLLKVTALYNDAGIITGYLGIAMDITERKNSEKELENYREQLERMVEERTKELSIANKELISSNEELNSLNEQLANQTSKLVSTLSKLKQTQNQLIQSEKLASLGVFTAGIAHEINNPVNYISAGALALLSNIKELRKKFAEQWTDEEMTRQFEEIDFSCHAIETGVEKTTAIISSLRNYSHSGNDSFIEYNVVQCLSDALVLLFNSYKHHIEIITDYPDKILIECIPSKMNQVFVNVINNSIQSIHGNGTIRISAAYVANQGNVLIEIEDSGSGIDPKIKDKIFDPFFTTKEAGKGTGLGLSIVHSIIKNHHGIIQLHSESKKGTKTTIVLPIKQPDHRK